MKPRNSGETSLVRCLKHGPRLLSLEECLELALANDRHVWRHVTEGLGEEEKARAVFLAFEEGSSERFSPLDALPPVQRAQLLATFEIARRYALHREQLIQVADDIPKSKKRHLALQRIPSELRNESREWIGFVAVYGTGRVGDLCVVERGVRTHVNFDAGDLFGKLLPLKARSFFLFHNHPSGRLVPSSSDLLMTEQISKMARWLNLALEGHWIVYGPRQKEIVEY